MERPISENCVALCRVSSTKQSAEGESLEVQESIIRRFVEAKGWKIVPDGRVWGTAISGRKIHRDDFEEVISYIKTHPGLVRYCVFRSIDRFTRAGVGEYERMKKELAKYGVEMVDTMGIVQPTRNTLEDLGFEYDWSQLSPSEITEHVFTTNAKNEVTNILTRMVGQSIRNTQQGYRSRASADGYKNRQIFVEGKKKTIQEPDPERAPFFVQMFQLRAQGLNDLEVVERINAAGYRSRIRNRYNKEHTKIIGKSGGRKLTVKQLQRIIENTIYAGVLCEKWTRYQPIRARYQGIVSMQLFNDANRGRATLKENRDGSIEFVKRSSKTGEARSKFNPLFPFKFVLCPVCEKPVLASQTRGKSGKRFAAYHCARNHPRFAVNKKDFDGAIERYVANLTFNPDILQGLEVSFMNKYREREKEVVQASGQIHRNIADLEAEQSAKLEAFTLSHSAVVRSKLEAEIENIELQIKAAQKQRLKIQITRNDIKTFIREARYVMEHPAEILLNPENPRLQKDLFNLVFEKMPTYSDFVNGTPKLSLIFGLSSGFTPDESQVMTPRGIEPRLTA